MNSHQIEMHCADSCGRGQRNDLDVNDGAGRSGCPSSCSPDLALQDNLDSQQQAIDDMQDEVNRMRELVRNMMSGIGCYSIIIIINIIICISSSRFILGGPKNTRTVFES